MKNYKILWTDMHSNIHHEDIDELPKWLDQIKNTMDFWPIAYYPYYMRKDESGLPLEDIYNKEICDKDFDYVREITNQANKEGFPMFMGYEWQGAGLDGDHNVFFLDNNQVMENPLRYEDLYKAYKNKNAIAIPHHTAYQLNNRGKNWDSHIDEFSPFIEVFSSHGSSESDDESIPMVRHIHMGPRCNSGTAIEGYRKGKRFGLIASGDNHHCPGIYGFGYCAVLSKSNSKEDIWDAFKNKRVYGVSKDRIKLNYSIDDVLMGSNVAPRKDATLKLNIEGANTIDRVEIIKDDKVYKVINYLEDVKPSSKVKFKFRVEFGWGPDNRIFDDIPYKKWACKLETKGKLLSIDKNWTNYGQKLINNDDHGCEFELTTYNSAINARWMAASGLTSEGFTFEIEDSIDSSIKLIVDSKEYEFKVEDILKGSILTSLDEEVKQLLKDKFNFTDYYRSDPFWHNSYKFKLHRGSLEEQYQKEITEKIDTTDCNLIRVRIWQKDGSVAWSSPIFMEE